MIDDKVADGALVMEITTANGARALVSGDTVLEMHDPHGEFKPKLPTVTFLDGDDDLGDFDGPACAIDNPECESCQ